MSKIIVRRQEYANNGTHANEIEAVVKENLIANTLSSATDVAPSVGLLKSTTDAINNSSVFKQGDVLNLTVPTGGRIQLAGRLGWARARVLVTIPLDKEITHLTSVSISGNNPIVYAPNEFRTCELSVNYASYVRNLLFIYFDITPETAWTVTTDCMANLEIIYGTTITINF